jgi:hypothetical protein
VRGQVGGDGLGLGGRDDRVVEPLQQQHRAGGAFTCPTGARSAYSDSHSGSGPIRPSRYRDSKSCVWAAKPRRSLTPKYEVAAAKTPFVRFPPPRPFRLLRRADADTGRHRGQRRPAAGRAAADAEPLAVRLARLGQRERRRHRVGHVHDAPLPAQPLPVGAAVPARPAVVHVDDPDAPAGEERLLQVEPGADLRGGTAVHPDDVRRQLTVGRPGRGVGRRVDERVHDGTGRPGQPGLAGHRQISGVRHRVQGPAQLVHLGGLLALARPRGCRP